MIHNRNSSFTLPLYIVIKSNKRHHHSIMLWPDGFCNQKVTVLSLLANTVKMNSTNAVIITKKMVF